MTPTNSSGSDHAATPRDWGACLSSNNKIISDINRGKTYSNNIEYLEMKKCLKGASYFPASHVMICRLSVCTDDESVTSVWWILTGTPTDGSLTYFLINSYSLSLTVHRVDKQLMCQIQCSSSDIYVCFLSLIAWQWHLSLHVWEDVGDGAEISNAETDAPLQDWERKRGKVQHITDSMQCCIVGILMRLGHRDPKVVFISAEWI